jgi:hypothetical protein
MDRQGQKHGGDAPGVGRRPLATPQKFAQGATGPGPSGAGRAWWGGTDDETPVRSYESYSRLQQQATEELGKAAQNLLGTGHAERPVVAERAVLGLAWEDGSGAAARCRSWSSRRGGCNRSSVAESLGVGRALAQHAAPAA